MLETLRTRKTLLIPAVLVIGALLYEARELCHERLIRWVDISGEQAMVVKIITEEMRNNASGVLSSKELLALASGVDCVDAEDRPYAPRCYFGTSDRNVSGNIFMNDGRISEVFLNTKTNTSGTNGEPVEVQDSYSQQNAGEGDSLPCPTNPQTSADVLRISRREITIHENDGQVTTVETATPKCFASNGENI